MSDASRLARLAYSKKPLGMPYGKFQISATALNDIEKCREVAVSNNAYAAAISYAEALSGIRVGSASWAIVKLYYSSFYSIRALLFLNGVVPFNFGDEMLLELPAGTLSKGGRSSHHWNWNSLRKTSVKNCWFISQDSEEAYQKLREHRENVNYTHAFCDPELHSSLASSEVEISKRFRTYRDDSIFVYTYLEEHLSLAYPTKLLFEVDNRVLSSAIGISQEQSNHLSSLWKIKDRCPLI